MSNLVVLSAACGVGKSAVREQLSISRALSNYICIDIDDVLNWWDYAGTDREEKFYEDCIAQAVSRAEGKNILLTTCMNPCDFYGKVNIPQEISSTFYIALICSGQEITRRLRERPAERNCGSDEFIAGQLEYNDWFRQNAGKFQLCIDNTDMTVGQTADRIASFIKGIPADV